MKLDGTDKIAATPFDAHEQVVRAPHTHSHPKNASVEAHEESGYRAAEYKFAAYPKAVAHNEELTEPVVARDAKHEAQLKGVKAA